jgi:uncharacterized membrane protein
MIRFFTKEQEKRIIAAIQEIERKTSGEIRVHLQRSCNGPVLDIGKKVFLELGMDKTARRNGVLFFIVPKEHQFAVLGDSGLDEVVPESFWEEVRNSMQEYFRKGEFEPGITKAIHMVGNYLVGHFPVEEDDENELSDDISYDDQ